MSLKIKSKTKVLVGLRLSHFLQENKNYINPEPRISGSYKLNEDIALKTSFAMMNQYVHLLSNTGIGLPTDLWVPSTDNVAPQKSKQVALGVAKDFLNKNLELTIEGYYKKSDDVIGYKEGASFLMIGDPSGAESISWEENITTGKGWSYGVEVLLQRKIGKLSGWVGYTLSWTQLQFDELNFGKKFWAKYDRRHDISLVGIYKLEENITISGTWIYGTGNAISLPIAEYQANYHTLPQDVVDYWWDYVIDYGEKNSFRMKAYHRLDFGIQFHKKAERFKNGQKTYEINIYNAYSRKNPFYYFSDYDYEKDENVIKQVSIFPIIPSFSYTLKF